MSPTDQTVWSDDDLTRIGTAEELDLASHRPDGTLRPFVTMWVVRVDDALCVRSARGPDNPWYRRAIAAGSGRIRADGVVRDVVFDDADLAVHDAVDAAYHHKYDRYGARIVGSVTGPGAASVTIRLRPKDEPT